MDAAHIVAHVVFHSPLLQGLSAELRLPDSLEAIAHLQVCETTLEDSTALMQTFPLHIVSPAFLRLLRQDCGLPGLGIVVGFQLIRRLAVDLTDQLFDCLVELFQGGDRAFS